jgi:hypothetical protein
VTQPEPLDPESTEPADWDDGGADEPGYDDHDPYEWWPPGTDGDVVAAQLAHGWCHDGADGWLDGRPYRTLPVAGGVL